MKLQKKKLQIFKKKNLSMFTNFISNSAHSSFLYIHIILLTFLVYMSFVVFLLDEESEDLLLGLRFLGRHNFCLECKNKNNIDTNVTNSKHSHTSHTLKSLFYLSETSDWRVIEHIKGNFSLLYWNLYDQSCCDYPCLLTGRLSLSIFWVYC